MSSICSIEFYYDLGGCPCQYSPEFKQWEQNYDRDRAIAETGCNPEQSQLTSLPVVGDASDVIDFKNSNLVEATDTFMLIAGLIVAFRLIFR